MVVKIQHGETPRVQNGEVWAIITQIGAIKDEQLGVIFQ